MFAALDTVITHQVMQIVQAEEASGVPRSRIIVGGFSQGFVVLSGSTDSQCQRNAGNRNYHACIYQGGAVALRAALLHPVGGCVVLSSYLAKHASLVQFAIQSSSNSFIFNPTQVNVEKCPIFMAHGLHDPVVRYEYGYKSYEHLKSLNVEVEFHKYPMQHESCPDEISDMIAFLKKHLN